MRLFLLLLLAYAASACAPGVDPHDLDSQPAYHYEGCDDGTLYCPQDRAFTCAIESIRSRHADCERDSDCTLVTLRSSCYEVGDCLPLAVRVGSESEALGEMATEVEAYCAFPGCRSTGQCGIVPEEVEAVCQEGSCVASLPGPT